MTDILIRGVDESLDKALRIRAIQHGLTREAEIKAILEAAVTKPQVKRSLAEALLAIPKIEGVQDIDDLFTRANSSARDQG